MRTAFSYFFLFIFPVLNAFTQNSPFISDEGQKAYYTCYDKVLSDHGIQYKDVWIESDLGRCHLVETGKLDGEPLLLLHAVGCSAAEWYANYKALGKYFHIYALDMPGDAGKSTAKQFANSIEDYNNMLCQIMDALNFSSINIIGHSLGGFFSAGFTISYPERVKSLILLAPAATHIKIKLPFSLLLKLETKPGKGPMAINTLKMQAYKGFEPDPSFVKLMESVRNYCRVKVLFPYLYSTPELRSITVPTHLIIGAEEVLCRYKKSMKLAKRKYGHIEIHLMDNTGHTANMERPDEFNNLILSILRK